MIIRKYDDGDSNLEVSITEDKKISFEINHAATFISIELTYKDAYDLKDQLYNLCREIEPLKSNG